MADINEVNGVFGGVELGSIGVDQTNNQNVIGGNQNVNGNNQNASDMFGNSFGTAQNYAAPAVTTKKNKNLPVKAGFWTKFKNFWLQDIPWNYEIKVELTPYQQKVEDEINEFLHQEITWEKVHDFLFQDVTFGSKK